MDLKFDKENNVCEYYNEMNGSIVNVLSNEEGLFFNLNDIFKMFGAIKSTKLWFSKNIPEEDRKWVEFDRRGRKSRELFIPEYKVHELIGKIKSDVNDNIDFIYGIIADYDITCINKDDVEFSTEEKLALYAIKSESQMFTERTEKYLDVLKGKTYLSEYLGNFTERLSHELEQTKKSYDNHKCPEDIRQEELESKKVNKTKKDSFIELVEQMQIDDCMDPIYTFIDDFKTNELDSPYEPIYDDFYNDIKESQNDAAHVQQVLDERTSRMNAFLNDIQKLENEVKSKPKVSSTRCPDWIRNVLK